MRNFLYFISILMLSSLAQANCKAIKSSMLVNQYDLKEASTGINSLQTAINAKTLLLQEYSSVSIVSVDKKERIGLGRRHSGKYVLVACNKN